LDALDAGQAGPLLVEEFGLALVGRFRVWALLLLACPL
jgi:hypothetical protein